MEPIKVMPTLKGYQRIVLAYQDEKDGIHIAHAFYYGGREGQEYLLFLYKDCLPAGDFIDGWNYMDENSVHITVVGEPDANTAVADFLACWNEQLNIEDVTLYEVKTFQDISAFFKEKKPGSGKAIGFLFD